MKESAVQHAKMLDAHARWWALKEQGAPDDEIAAAWATAQGEFEVHSTKKSCATG